MFILQKWKKKRKLKKEIKLHDKSYVDNPIKLEEMPKRTTYKYKIILLNHETLEGECTVSCPDDLAKMFLSNECNVLGDGKVLWYNPDTMVSFCAIEKEKEEQ